MIRHERARRSSFSLNPLMPWNTPESQPHSFTSPKGGWHVSFTQIHPSLSLSYCSGGVGWMCVDVIVGCTDRDEEAEPSVPWETLFAAYRSPSMLGGLDWLKGWKCNLFSCWDLWEWIHTQCCCCCFELTHASRKLILSAGAKRSGKLRWRLDFCYWPCLWSYKSF